MAYVPVAAPVYGSVEQIEQFASPQTSSRYAVIPGLGMFAWYPLDTTSRNGTTVLGTGVIGRWKLSDTFGNGSVWKQACFVAADSNVTLSGTQTIDGQSVTAGKVVFCTAQTAPAENGPWICAAGAWARPSWFDAAADAQSGAVFPVIAGTTYGGSLWMLTSPTSGTITPGTTAITVEQVSGGGSTTSSSLSLPIVLDRNQLINASGSGTTLVLSQAASGHVDGTTTEIFIAAYSRSGLVIPNDWNAVNSDGTAFSSDTWDQSLDTKITARRAFGRTTSVVQAIAQVDSLPAQIVYALCPTANPDTIEITFDGPMFSPSLTGVSLSGTMAVARTITSIINPDTTPRVRLQLSGALDPADVVNVVFSSANAWTDLSGNALAAQSIGVFWLSDPTEAAGYTASFFADVPPSGSQMIWPEYSGIIGRILQQVNATNQPTVTTHGYDNAQTIEFDGVDNYLSAADAASNYVSASTKYILQAFIPRTAHLNLTYGAAPNDAVMGIGGTGFGWTVRSGTDGDSYEGIATNYGGTDPYMESAPSVPMQRQSPALVRIRHASSRIYGKKNRDAENAGTASNATSAGMASGFVIGSQTGGDRFLKCAYMGLIMCNQDQTAQKAEGLESFMMTKPWGTFLRHTLRVPVTDYAFVGVQYKIVWEQIMLVPTPVFTSCALSQYTWSVSGVTGATVNSTGMTWTPGSGDVGTKTVTVTASIGTRVVATGKYSLVVSAASKTGSVKVLCVGDSWTASNAYSKQVYTRLTAAGMTVTMLGTRGGQVVSAVNTTTNQLTITSHGYVADQPLDWVLALSGSPSLPAVSGAALAAYQTCYVKTVVDANTIEVSRTQGGAIIDFTGVGSGTFYLRAANERHEGRGGWSWRHFADINTPNPNDGASPFLDAEGNIDIATYVAAVGGTPDIVFWQLGINDGLNNGIYADDHDAFDDHVRAHLVLYAERMMAAFRSYNSNIRQAVVLPSAPNLRQAAFESAYGTLHWRDGWRRGVWRIVQAYSDRFATARTDNVTAVPAFCVDTYADFPAADPAHPSTAPAQAVGDGWAACALAILP